MRLSLPRKYDRKYNKWKGGTKELKAHARKWE